MFCNLAPVWRFQSGSWICSRIQSGSRCLGRRDWLVTFAVRYQDFLFMVQALTDYRASLPDWHICHIATLAHLPHTPDCNRGQTCQNTMPARPEKMLDMPDCAFCQTATSEYVPHCQFAYVAKIARLHGLPDWVSTILNKSQIVGSM